MTTEDMKIPATTLDGATGPGTERSERSGRGRGVGEGKGREVLDTTGGGGRRPGEKRVQDTRRKTKKRERRRSIDASDSAIDWPGVARSKQLVELEHEQLKVRVSLME